MVEFAELLKRIGDGASLDAAEAYAAMNAEPPSRRRAARAAVGPR